MAAAEVIAGPRTMAGGTMWRVLADGQAQVLVRGRWRPARGAEVEAIDEARHRPDAARLARSLLVDGECIDPTTGIANLTGLAESVAWAMDQDQWLDDPLHWIWDLASEVATEKGIAP